MPLSHGEADLNVVFNDQEASSGGLKEKLPEYNAASLLYRLHKPIRGWLSEEVRKEYSPYDHAIAVSFLFFFFSFREKYDCSLFYLSPSVTQDLQHYFH